MANRTEGVEQGTKTNRIFNWRDNELSRPCSLQHSRYRADLLSPGMMCEDSGVLMKKRVPIRTLNGSNWWYVQHTDAGERFV